MSHSNTETRKHLPARKLSIVVLLLLAVGLIVFGINKEKKYGDLKFRHLSAQFEADLSILTLSLSKTIHDQTTTNANTADFLSIFSQQAIFKNQLQNIYLALEDGTYYSETAGNPHLNYLVSLDDSDHASELASLIDRPFWQNHFLSPKKNEIYLWADPFREQSLLLAIPFLHKINNQPLLLAVSIDPSDWLISDDNRFQLLVTDGNNIIWRNDLSDEANSATFTRPLKLSKNMVLRGSYSTNLLPYILPLPTLTLIAVFFLTRRSGHRNETNKTLNTQQIICDELKLMTIEADQNGKVLKSSGTLPSEFESFKINIDDSLKELLKNHPRYLTYLHHSLTGEKLTYEVEKNEHCIRVHQRPVTSSTGSILGLSIIIQEITDQKNIERQLKYQQFHDDLTGLPNRQLFMEQLQQELHKAKRRQEFVAVLALEVNGIGNINKQYGHQTGDKMLRAIAVELKNALRDEDIICRFSDDEFLLSFENYHQPDELTQISERLISIASTNTEIENQKLRLSANIGIATYPRDARDPGSLVSNAITAMRHARQTGRNTLDYFSEDNAKMALEKWQLEQNLTTAINSHAFCLYYQPIFNLKTNQCIGAEALIRWPSANLAPDQFIPTAEETGLIYEIGLWVIKTALHQFSQWKAQKCSIQYISINLSVIQLNNSNFFPELDDLINQYPFNKGEIVLEITETVMMKTTESTVAKLKELRNRGFKLAIDDFGTGFSSLNYLKYLPVTTLKVDRSFVDGIPEKSHDTVICEAIIQMAIAMDLDIIAEGVETPVQMNWLLEHGVTTAQGYFFAHPVPAEDFKRYLTNPDIAQETSN